MGTRQKILIGLGALCALVLLSWALDDSEAMAKCQETHSFSTCHYALHR